LPDISVLPCLADVLETTIDYILHCSEPRFSFKGKITISDMIDGLNHLKMMGKKSGTENIIYRHAIEGINQGMNTDIEPAFTDDFILKLLSQKLLSKISNRGYISILPISVAVSSTIISEISFLNIPGSIPLPDLSSYSSRPEKTTPLSGVFFLLFCLIGCCVQTTYSPLTRTLSSHNSFHIINI